MIKTWLENVSEENGRSLRRFLLRAQQFSDAIFQEFILEDDGLLRVSFFNVQNLQEVQQFGDWKCSPLKEEIEES